jgi:hypothetical protein
MTTWMRARAGSSSLRHLVYMDEVYGYVPPVREPPSKKAILTMLKQARAFGFGMLLATQNPVDLDYKALSNAGTWMIGRLQTEQDKDRLLDGLDSASGGVDTDAFASLIAGLEKRQFVLHSTGSPSPLVFATRWAQSYLAGPLTRDQVGKLMSGRDAAPAAASAPTETDAFPEPEVGDDVVPVMPPVADKVETYFLDPAAPWIGQVGGGAGGNSVALGAVATIQLLYDDTPSKLSHSEVYEAVVYPLGPVISADNVFNVDHDDRDFRRDPPSEATFELPEAKVDTASYWSGLEKDLIAHLVANRPIQIFKNGALKLYSRVGETAEDFEIRSREASSDAADAEIAKLKDKYQARIDRVKDQISQAENRVSELQSVAASKQQEELVTGVGEVLGGLLGGRKSSTALSKAASRRTATRSARARAETAAGGLSDKMSDLAELEVELEDDVMEITDRYEGVSGEIETVDVGLEATDVRVVDLKAVWIPI